MNFQEELLFERVCRILYSKYGQITTFVDITSCAQEWVDKGHKIPDGCVAYFETYFLKQ